MGQPDKDEFKDIPPSAADLIENIDTYQKRVEQEWDTAKAAYQKKINQIMEEFLDQGFTLETPASSNEPLHSQPKENFERTSSKKQNITDNHMASLLARVENELRSSGRKTKQLTFFEKRPMSFSVSWQENSFQIPKPRFKTSFIFLVLISLGVAAFLLMQSPKLISLPYAHTLGPVVVGERIYVADWFRKSLYVHSMKRGFPILAVENLPNNLMTGLAMDAKAVWTLDGMDKKLVKHAPTLDHQVQSSFDAPGQKPAGLFFDGTDLWSADQENNTIYRHRGNDVEDIRDEFPIPSGTVTAFSILNNRAWVLDGKSREIFVYRLQKPLKELGNFDLDPFLKGATPTGFTLVKKNIWIVTENPAALIKIPSSKLEKSTTERF